jgi:hypothetical protein
MELTITQTTWKYERGQARHHLRSVNGQRKLLLMLLDAIRSYERAYNRLPAVVVYPGYGGRGSAGTHVKHIANAFKQIAFMCIDGASCDIEMPDNVNECPRHVGDGIGQITIEQVIGSVRQVCENSMDVLFFSDMRIATANAQHPCPKEDDRWKMQINGMHAKFLDAHFGYYSFKTHIPFHEEHEEIIEIPFRHDNVVLMYPYLKALSVEMRVNGTPADLKVHRVNRKMIENRVYEHNCTVSQDELLAAIQGRIPEQIDQLFKGEHAYKLKSQSKKKNPAFTPPVAPVTNRADKSRSKRDPVPVRPVAPVVDRANKPRLTTAPRERSPQQAPPLRTTKRPTIIHVTPENAHQYLIGNWEGTLMFGGKPSQPKSNPRQQ